MNIEKSVHSVNEGRAIFSLALILCFRMLGLFMIFPIFALYAPTFHYATPTLIGFALGIYGLTQAALQLPFSILSDYLGRKPVILIGLTLFAIGSVIAALTQNIYWVILGRGLQGAGAIGSTLMAYAADLSRIETRTKAMAILGVTIGGSFALAMIFGPLLNTFFHLSGIFWLTALFAVLGMGIIYTIPNPKKYISHPSSTRLLQLKTLVQSRDLLRLNISILILHAILTASFTVIPLMFNEVILVATWKLYLPVLLGAFILVTPLMMMVERKHLIRLAINISFAIMSISQLIFYYFSSSSFAIISALLIFFVGFTLLEGLLPSYISKIAPFEQRGSAMGIFSTFQFLGIFLGGCGAGMIRTHWHNHDIFLFCTLLALFWLCFTLTMKAPIQLKTKILTIQKDLDEPTARVLSKQLNAIEGVLEANVSIEHSIAYLKVDNKMFDQQALREALLLL